MMKSFKYYSALYLIVIFFSILTPIQSKNNHLLLPHNSNRNQYLIIWAHSDIQPRNKKERDDYEFVINDIVKNLPYIDTAIVAGDIIHNKKNCYMDYEWFLNVRKKAKIPFWYEITGNHDSRDIETYTKYIKKPLQYAVITGNLLIIFLSDEDGKLATAISDRAFRWWRKMVIDNQDMIIITITHSNLPESNLFLSDISLLSISNSSRFAEVLEKYHVDIWLAGHIHLPSLWGLNERRVKELNNTQFINISRIRRDFGMHSESRFLIFKKESPYITIKTRDHIRHMFIKKREINLKLRSQFKYNNKSQEIIIPK